MEPCQPAATEAPARAAASADDAERAFFVRLSTCLWGLLAAVTVLGLGGLHLGGVAIDPMSFRTVNVAVGLPLAVVGLIYTYWRFDRQVAAIASTLALLALAIPTLCMTSYGAQILSRPFPISDAALHALDQRLGFDWQAMADVLQAHPALATLARWAYDSITVQAAIMAVALIATRQVHRLQLVFVVFFIGCLLCQAGSILAPAHGVYAFLGITPETFAPYNPALADVPATVDALRAGQFPLFSPANANGIITFPSFHSTLAILFAWAFWATPWLRWPAVALNIAMLLATPPLGAHYLVDVIAGIAIAIVAILAAQALSRRLAGQSQRPSAAPRLLPA